MILNGMYVQSTYSAIQISLLCLSVVLWCLLVAQIMENLTNKRMKKEGLLDRVCKFGGGCFYPFAFVCNV